MTLFFDLRRSFMFLWRRAAVRISVTYAAAVLAVSLLSMSFIYHQVQAAGAGAYTLPTPKTRLSFEKVSGEYACSDGFWATAIRIDKNHRFFMHDSWCTGTSQCSGRAEMANGYVVLVAEKATHDYHDNIPRAKEIPAPILLQPVRWGQRLYLIPAERIDWFRQETHNKTPDTHYGDFPVKGSDWEKPVYGEPEI